ncbi:hypothetical protein HA402_009503 [Bradysia odoriphaga]|nr:hypothetical protein HA402_009503 [Bradysia odoriphaga]
MKICAILLLLVTAAESFLHCIYSRNYQCDFTINNPNGLYNFTEIGGVHLVNFTNDDVTRLSIIRNADSISTNVPSLICDTFPNLAWIELTTIGLTEIGDDDIASCSQLVRLRLDSNNIRAISGNAFIRLVGLEEIDLSRNNLTTLPQNVFVNQINLHRLDLQFNPLDTIPDGLLQSLEKLDTFFVTSIDEVKSQCFVNTRLQTLWVTHSRVAALPDSFTGLENVRTFLFTNNEISEIRSGGFSGLRKLEVLYLNGNKLTELQADTFLGLKNLIHLFVSNNPIELIKENAFRGLDSLSSLNMEVCRLRQIQTNSFQHLPRLTSISLSINQIGELPEGVFSAFDLRSVSVSQNQLQSLHRNSFGSLRNLDWFAVGSNNIQAVDATIIDDALRLNNFFFFDNSCASFSSRDFVANRTELLPELKECFDNYETLLIQQPMVMGIQQPTW